MKLSKRDRDLLDAYTSATQQTYWLDDQGNGSAVGSAYEYYIKMRVKMERRLARALAPRKKVVA